MVGRIAAMGAMKTLMLAEASVRKYLILSFNVTMTVAYGGSMPALLRHSPCVTTVETWMNHFAITSVTQHSQEMRTRIGGLVKMALRLLARDVSSRRLAVTGIQIVTMPLN